MACRCLIETDKGSRYETETFDLKPNDDGELRGLILTAVIPSCMDLLQARSVSVTAEGESSATFERIQVKFSGVVTDVRWKGGSLYVASVRSSEAPEIENEFQAAVRRAVARAAEFGLDPAELT